MLKPQYDQMQYRRCGKSGLKLPVLSLGLWHNFGGIDALENQRALLLHSFEQGITHFDLANNYGPPAGSAEENFGRLMKDELAAHRDELIISSKAGYRMWPGPYGEWGSRKYMVSSCDQSLKRMGLDYVDIFYSHRFDPETPLEETMGALDHIVRSGRALYAGISSYTAEKTREAAAILERLGTPCLIHQPRYNMFDRWVEKDLLATLGEKGIGCITFSPLEQGILTRRYLDGIPPDSRAGRGQGFLKAKAITEERLAIVRRLDAFAREKEMSVTQLAVAWILRREQVTSVLIGASKTEQIDECLKGALRDPLDASDWAEVEKILS